MKVLVVTDPLCSWCWGMAPAVEEVSARLADEVEFELLLGGINPRSTRPVGDYGQRLLKHIWREVQATTGQAFSFKVPDGMVFNSTRPCLAVAALRRATGKPPFGYLHRLQQLLFMEGRDITDVDLLAGVATEFDLRADVIRQGFDDPSLRADLAAEFAGARRYGTQALPNVVTEQAGERALLAGGYADADMLEALIRGRLGADQL